MLAFIRHQFVVDGYLVGPPTVETAVAATLRFRAELRTLAKAMAEGADASILLSGMASSVSRPELALVLSTCVERIDRPHETRSSLLSANRETLVALAAVVLECCDAPKVLDSLGIDTTEEQQAAIEQQASSDLPSPFELSLVKMAMQFGQRPSEIMRWSWEEFIATSDLMAFLKAADKSGNGAGSPQSIDEFAAEASAIFARA